MRFPFSMSLVSGALLSVAFSLGGCGQRGTLSMPPGHSPQIKPETSLVMPDRQDLMTPPSQARPDKSQDILLHSTVRTEDYFDLPPR